MLFEIDNLCSIRTKSLGRKKDKITRKITKLRKRIFNLKKELIHQSASYITNNYSIVLMPKLETQEISRLETTTKYLAREITCTSHCTFFNHLKYKCKEKGVRFLHVNEDYTSQTCNKCGFKQKDEKEIHECSNCNYRCDRDVNGAFNILLKAIRVPG